MFMPVAPLIETSFMGQQTTQSAQRVAHVHEGETEFITLHRQNEDRIPLEVTRQLIDHLSQVTATLGATDQINKVLALAAERLERDYSDRIELISRRPKLSDGEIVIAVKPRGGIFDMQLALDLNRLSWEFEEILIEALGTEHPVMLGFRQEFPDEHDRESPVSLEE